MSIDAKVAGVRVRPDGECVLYLEPRESYGHAGQSEMTVLNPPDPPERLEHLIHCELWGNASLLMLGDEHIADREGYTALRLVDDWALMVKDWHEKKTGEHPPA